MPSATISRFPRPVSQPALFQASESRGCSQSEPVPARTSRVISLAIQRVKHIRHRLLTFLRTAQVPDYAPVQTVRAARAKFSVLEARLQLATEGGRQISFNLVVFRVGRPRLLTRFRLLGFMLGGHNVDRGVINVKTDEASASAHQTAPESGLNIRN